MWLQTRHPPSLPDGRGPQGQHLGDLHAVRVTAGAADLGVLDVAAAGQDALVRRELDLLDRPLPVVAPHGKVGGAAEDDRQPFTLELLKPVEQPLTRLPAETVQGDDLRPVREKVERAPRRRRRSRESSSCPGRAPGREPSPGSLPRLLAASHSTPTRRAGAFSCGRPKPPTRAIIRARREPARDRAHTEVPPMQSARAMIYGDKRRGVSV